MQSTPEAEVSRVIKPESAGKDRLQLTRSIVRAIQELMKQTEITDKTRDLASFIAIALEAIAGTIDTSVEAWEKRGYWLKADRFRLEWEWAGRLGGRMMEATKKEDWGTVAITAAQIAEKLKNVELPKRPPKTEPWEGAWARLNSSNRPER
jgi:hypothetical protein